MTNEQWEGLRRRAATGGVRMVEVPEGTVPVFLTRQELRAAVTNDQSAGGFEERSDGWWQVLDRFWEKVYDAAE